MGIWEGLITITAILVTGAVGIVRLVTDKYN
jgi:hypothetical protein